MSGKWEYRLAVASKNHFGELCDVYGIVEHYWDLEDEQDKGWVTDFKELGQWDNLSDLSGTLSLMLKALDKPVLVRFNEDDEVVWL